MTETEAKTMKKLLEEMDFVTYKVHAYESTVMGKNWWALEVACLKPTSLHTISDVALFIESEIDRDD